jgi:hypothetical protein
LRKLRALPEQADAPAVEPKQLPQSSAQELEVRYRLPCDCGAVILASAGDAGSQLGCACGRTVTAPHWSRLTKLEQELVPVRIESHAAPASASTSPSQGFSEQHGGMTGRQIVNAIMIVVVLIELCLLLSAVLSGGVVFTGVIRLMLTLGLFYCLNSGMPWARWVFNVLFNVGGTLGLVFGIILGNWFLILVGPLYLYFAWCIAFHPKVTAFLRAQELSRHESRD